MGRLEGKVVVVTGGASGLGRAIAQRLASEGGAVVITDVQEQAGRTAAAEGGFMFLAQDVRDETRWTDVMHEVKSAHGRLDVLVNNAGILGPKDADDPENTRLADWRAIFAVNVEGVFLGCRAAIRAMRPRGTGSIINIASIAGLLATPHATAYGASKAAVRQLTRSVAQHCAEQGLDIRCNAVDPGNAPTPLWLRAQEERARLRAVPVETIVADALAAIPQRRFTTPEDVAAVVAFLASDDARHITGSEVVVDGGVVGCDTYRPRAQSPAGAQHGSRGD